MGRHTTVLKKVNIVFVRISLRRFTETSMQAGVEASELVAEADTGVEKLV
jgi:hypothetical protein